MYLYGRNWTRREIEARVGRLEQIGCLRRLKWTEGVESDVEHVQIRTGSGLSYYVSPSRGLDISLAEFSGIPLSWQSPNGDVHPSYYNAKDTQWLRTATGGLLMTCGLTQVGSPCQDDGQEYGMHGGIHHLPASHVAAEGYWIEDHYEMRIRGVINEVSIFGEHLRLTREIKSRLGENRIKIKDIVENVGFQTTPHMMLYHFNFGFPLMSETTEIIFPSHRVVAREQSTPLNGYNEWQTPDSDYEERVYYHEILNPDKEVLNHESRNTEVVIHNPYFPINGVQTNSISVHLKWSTVHLPRLVQWKMPGAGTHVLGIEPANCGVGGRAAERERGTLVYIKPGEALTYELELNVACEF